MIGLSDAAFLAIIGSDTTAPTLSSPTGTQTGSTTATLGVTTDEANGTLYSFVSTSATPPSGTDLKAGTGAVFANSQSITTTGAKTASATGLTAATTYYAHWLHSDAAGNDSSIATSASFTTASASFAPTDETGLYYWFDASDSATITIATGVSQLDDKSGNTLHAVQATGANQPTVAAASVNGLDTILYDTTDSLVAPDHVVTFLHVFAVVKNISSTSNRTIVRKGYSTGCYTLRFTSATNVSAFVRNQAPTQSSVINATAPTGVCIVELMYDGSTVSLRVDGGTASTTSLAGTSLWDTAEGLGLGATTDAGDLSTLNSNFCEVFAYNTVKDSTVSASARTYLKNKWGTA